MSKTGLVPSSWTPQDRKFFRGVRDEIVRLGKLILHPKTGTLTKAEIHTIAHNTAWIAVEEKMRTEGRKP